MSTIEQASLSSRRVLRPGNSQIADRRGATRLPRTGGRCVPITAAAVILAVLYAGRDVLMPLVVAIMLSLLLAPMVRVLTRVGLPRLPSVFLAVLAFTGTCVAGALVLGTQVLRIAQSIPQYQVVVERKLQTVNAVTEGRLTLLTDQAKRLLEGRDPTGTITQLTAPVTHAAQTIGIVLLVLVFALLEYESLRDRFIRLVGAADIHKATLALDDAGQRLSRFFVSQFVVNLSFGLAVGLGLAILQVPQAMLLGTLAGVMRFVPYVGVGIAALLSTVLALIVEPGWSLAAATLGVFVLLDVIVGQLLEPHLYGHATGLSPLAVVVAAIFWSSIWGPVGLILSTPLTLCLVVAGRHIESLGILQLLLSNSQALTLPQKFYQRSLSGDPHEIINDARVFLRRNSLTSYCDRVLIPAIHLAHLDAHRGATSEEQRVQIRRVVVDVVSALSSEGLRLPKRRYGSSVLDEDNVGNWLRQQRERVSGRWQGPLGVAPGSVVLCLGLGSPADDLVAELFARVLLVQKLDARHFALAELNDGLPEGADPNGVSLVYLMSAFPETEREHAHPLQTRIRTTFPHAHVITVFFPGISGPWNMKVSVDDSCLLANSLTEALEISHGLSADSGVRNPNGHCP